MKRNGDVERIIRGCRDRLPALCVEVQKTLTDANPKTSSTLSLVTTFSSRTEKPSTSPRSTSQVINETTVKATLEFQETTSPVLEELPSSLPSKDGVSGNDKQTFMINMLIMLNFKYTLPLRFFNCIFKLKH